jgi:hypothetical protein
MKKKKSTVVTRERLKKIWREWVSYDGWPEATYQAFLLKKLGL